MAVTHAQIEPTTRCNFTCGFCAGRAMAQQDLGWDAYVAFLDAHPALRKIELQGEGEPLLHKRFFDMLAEAHRRGIATALITNGSLLDEAAVERLLAGGVDSIHVSMESADPARFQAIRGGKFAKVRAGLARLAARRRALGLARPVIGIAATVLRSTIAGVGDILDLYEAERLDGGIILQPLQGMAAYSRHYAPEMIAEMLPPDQRLRLEALRGEAMRRAPIRSPRDFFYADLHLGFDPRRDTCPWLARGAYLTAASTMTACAFMKEPEQGTRDPLVFAQRRFAMIEALDRAQVPAACAGCGTAHAVASARSLVQLR